MCYAFCQGLASRAWRGGGTSLLMVKGWQDMLILPTCRFRSLFMGCCVVTSTEVHGRGVFGQRRRQIYGHDGWIHSMAEHINFWPPIESVLRCRYQCLCCAEADGKSMAPYVYSIWSLLFSNLVSDFLFLF